VCFTGRQTRWHHPPDSTRSKEEGYQVTTTTKRKQTGKPAVDWSLAPRGTASAAVEATLGLTALAAVGHAAHATPLLGAAGAVAGALGHVMVATHHDAPPSALGYRMACWAGGGGWLTWSLLSTPWSVNTLAGLGIGAVVAGICAPLGRIRPKKQAGQEAGPGGAVVLSGGGRIGRAWQARIAQVCRVQVAVTEVDDWDTRTGYDIHVDLPVDGTTVDDIKRHSKALATHARLPRGCRVDVDEGALQGQVILRVAVVNRLLEELPWGDDLSPRSILDGVDLGEHQDGSRVVVPLREETALAVGATGSGKTNLLDLFTAGVGLCTDALVWHIDLNGGGMSWAWLKPWLDGETDRPAVDWAASTLDEAYLMVQIAYAIALDRKGSSHHLKVAANSRLMPISPALPEIVIVVDEGKTVLSGSATGVVGKVRDLLTKIQDESRDAGIRLVTSALRATSTAIDGDFKAQVGVKIGLTVEKDAELAYLFDWDAGLKCADLPTKGCGYVQYSRKAPRMFKTRHMLPSDIHAAALAAARHRPDLDKAALAIGSHVYRSRHERMRDYFGRVSGRDGNSPASPAELVPAAQAAPAAAQTPGWQPTPAAGHPHLVLVDSAAVDSARADQWDDPHALVGAVSQPPVADASAWPDPAPGQTATGTIPPATRHPAIADTARQVQPLPEILIRCMAAFARARDTRMHAETLAAALGMSKDQLRELLAPLGVTTLRRAFERGGQELRGYELSDLEAAAERIASGELTVPPDVAAWPA
jgi:S-DNA-T family DNA segregation ATPase FtsK/SpoIIIE